MIPCKSPTLPIDPHSELRGLGEKSLIAKAG